MVLLTSTCPAQSVTKLLSDMAARYRADRKEYVVRVSLLDRPDQSVAIDGIGQNPGLESSLARMEGGL